MVIELPVELIEVKCYSGYKAEESPQSFTWRGKEYIVEEISQSRREEKVRRRWSRKVIFRVKTSSGQVFEISYHEQTDKWFMEKELVREQGEGKSEKKKD